MPRAQYTGDCARCGRAFQCINRRQRFCSRRCAYDNIPCPPAEIRCWQKTNKTPTCWWWTGTIRADGYGELHVGGRKGRMVRAHRFVWELVNGPIPKGLYVLHKCDNRGCVNPDHLFLGTHQDNMIDMWQKGRGRNKLHDHPELALKGEEQPNAKLTEDKVRTIRAEYAAGGVSYETLGRKYGVSGSAVLYVVRRQTWRHVA